MLSDNQGSGPGQVAADTEAREAFVGRLLRENKFCEARRLLEDELALRQNHPKALFFLACMQGIGLGGREDIASARQLLSLIENLVGPYVGLDDPTARAGHPRTPGFHTGHAHVLRLHIQRSYGVRQRVPTPRRSTSLPPGPHTRP